MMNPITAVKDAVSKKKNSPAENPPHDKLGLVLEGGGVKGAYQRGALSALAEAGIRFDGIAGTSIGALNGALLASQGTQALERAWEEVKACDAFEFTAEMVNRFKKRDFDLEMIAAAGKKMLKERSILKESYEHACEFIKEWLDEDKIRASEVDFGCVVYNLSDMKPFEAMKSDIPEGLLIEYVIASACFPVFPPRVIDSKKYIDGGVYDNMPVNLLGANGYRKMAVIRTHPASTPPKRKIERDDLKIVYIAPSADLGAPLAFSPERIDQLIERGYNDAKISLANGLFSFVSSEI